MGEPVGESAAAVPESLASLEGSARKFVAGERGSIRVISLASSEDVAPESPLSDPSPAPSSDLADQFESLIETEIQACRARQQSEPLVPDQPEPSSGGGSSEPFTSSLPCAAAPSEEQGSAIFTAFPGLADLGAVSQEKVELAASTPSQAPKDKQVDY